MATTLQLTEAQMSELANGQVLLEDGRLLRFRDEPDNDHSINDFDCWGHAEPARISRFSAHYEDRPKHFDGTAEILWGYNDPYWWQPPVFSKEDRRRWHTDKVWANTVRQEAKEILAFGFRDFFLEECNGVDAYGKPIVTKWHVMGAIEPILSHEDTMSVLSEMVYEMYYDPSPTQD